MAKSDFWMQHRIRVRWNELDSQGIAHNAVYLVWFGVAMGEYFRGLPFDRPTIWTRDNTQINVVRTLIEYKSPAGMDEEIDACCRVGRIGRTSVTFIYEIYGADGRLLCSGDQVWVNVSKATMRPTEWAAEFLERVNAREGRISATDGS